ncbi:putative serine esterase (DUF676) domain containing protein [Elaphomyces granulatus]|jgi:hypothetical protein
MADVDIKAPTDSPPKTDHLCVLIHGLWGNPSHLDYLASALQERYGESHLYVLKAQRNTGSFTYDGIELGGERVAYEIEDTLDQLAAKGYRIRKLSVVGYSLGGLVARYALGLLDARGWLDKLEPVNFTTFVTPHVGVRTPSKGFHNHIWNVMGARALSISGRQLFMIDSFRGTGKPLLSILADPDSIFMHALAKFKHRSLYANVFSDRATVYYTAAISKVDPFMELENVDFKYIKDYEPNIIDPGQPLLLKTKRTATITTLSYADRQFFKAIIQLPLILFLSVFAPIATICFLLNSVFQTICSHRRRRLHEEGKTGVVFGSYRVPLIVQEVRNVVEDVFESMNGSQKPEYLTDSSDDFEEETKLRWRPKEPGFLSSCEKDSFMEDECTALIGQMETAQEHDVVEGQNFPSPRVDCSTSGFPTLALTPSQFAIIDSLNLLGFRKYPVYIHNHRHSHAAIIVRMPKKGFEEGRIVVKHWLDTEFKV